MATPTQVKPLFIADQRVFKLNLAGERRRRAKELFSGSNLQDPERDDQIAESTSRTSRDTSDDQEEPQWLPIEDRFAALASLDSRLIAVTVSSGIGKTNLVDQLQIVRAAEHRGHVIVRLHATELPTQAIAFAGDRDTCSSRDDPLLVKHIRDWASDQGDGFVFPTKAETQAFDVLTRWLQQKIRNGLFTLIVDGLDECDTTKGEDQLKALRRFLNHYRHCRCVVAGRPYAITNGNYWKALFADNDAVGVESPGSEWDFWLVAPFDREQRERYLGPEISQQLRLIESDIEFTPRLLEKLKSLAATKIRSIRSASDVYWHTTYQGIQTDQFKEGLPVNHSFDTQELLDIFSAIAISMVQRESSECEQDGIVKAAPENVIAGSSKVKQLFADVRNRLESIRYQLDQQTWADFRKLGSSLVEFNFLRDNSTDRIEWRNATERDFFAALWMVRSSNEEDRAWFAERQSSVLKYQEEESRHPELYEVWKFVCEMPADAFEERVDELGKTGRWLHCVAPLFQRPSHVRSNELIYRTWPRLLQEMGRLKPEWTEHNLDDASAELQWEIQQRFELETAPSSANPPIPTRRVSESQQIPTRSVSEDLQIPTRSVSEDYKLLPHRVSEATDAITADSIATKFLTEYLCIRADTSTDAATICREDLESAMRDVGAEPGKSFLCGHVDEDDNQPQQRTLRRGFELCAYQVTNRLYALYDAQHSKRFGEIYTEYCPQPRCPAIYINFYDAWAASLWLHACLPDEWEWEYVIRAGQNTSEGPQPIYPFGNDKSKLPQHARCSASKFRNGRRCTQEVGQLLPVRIGDNAIYDMLGNVWERVRNRYSSDGVSRVLRGGSFSDTDDVRCSCRDNVAPSGSSNVNGFRVARARKGKS